MTAPDRTAANLSRYSAALDAFEAQLERTKAQAHATIAEAVRTRDAVRLLAGARLDHGTPALFDLREATA